VRLPLGKGEYAHCFPCPFSIRHRTFADNLDPISCPSMPSCRDTQSHFATPPRGLHTLWTAPVHPRIQSSYWPLGCFL